MGNEKVGPTVTASGISRSPEARKREDRQTLGTLKRRLKNIDETKIAIANTIESLEKLKFNPGDFVVHKIYGNCVINDYYVKDYPIDEFERPRESAEPHYPDFGYYLSSPNWDIFHPVSEEDIIEYNSTTKLLYDK